MNAKTLPATGTIACGEWALCFDAARGGLIRSLTRGGVDILRPMPEASEEVLDSACFPLAPYANRIADGRFAWDGQSYTLTPNHPAIAHPLHGTAWLGAWRVSHLCENSVTQVHTHSADAAWPWSFALEQTLVLTQRGLSAGLTLTNTDARAMPAGLGFHPWFAREGVLALSFEAQGVWLSDEAMLPTHEVAADHFGDWRVPCPLEREELIDNCYTGWSGSALIARGDGPVRLESHGTHFFHLFVPPEGDFFCTEPQTTMPNAVNKGAPMRLEPGQSLSLAMTIGNA